MKRLNGRGRISRQALADQGERNHTNRIMKLTKVALWGGGGAMALSLGIIAASGAGDREAMFPSYLIASSIVFAAGVIASAVKRP